MAEIKLLEPVAALVKLGQHLGLFMERSERTLKVQHEDLRTMSDEDLIAETEALLAKAKAGLPAGGKGNR